MILEAWQGVKKPLYKFGLGAGRHRTRRRALCLGKNYGKYTSHFMEEHGNSNILVIKQRSRTEKKKIKSIKKQSLKTFYQLYRSPVTGQLMKRYVKQLFKNAANGYRFINISSLQQHVSEISLHSATFEKAI